MTLYGGGSIDPFDPLGSTPDTNAHAYCYTVKLLNDMIVHFWKPQI